MIKEQSSDLWYWWAKNLHPYAKEKKKSPWGRIKTLFSNFSKKASDLVSKFVPDISEFSKLFQKGGADNKKKLKKRIAYFENFKIFLNENKLASSKSIALIKYLYLCVPLFSMSTFIENVFQNVYPTHKKHHPLLD